jgi:hypothetical protein
VTIAILVPQKSDDFVEGLAECFVSTEFRVDFSPKRAQVGHPDLVSAGEQAAISSQQPITLRAIKMAVG